MTPSKREVESAVRGAESAVRNAASRATDEGKKTALRIAAGTAAAAATAEVGRRVLSSDDEELRDSSAYRLLEGEPVAAGIKRVVLARVDDALADLRGETDHEPLEAVHEARKDLKKTRSALRLVRNELGDEIYRRENDHYRDVGRTLSEFRDAEVLVETLDGLEDRFGAASRDRFAPLREQLETDLSATRDDRSLERAMASAASALAGGRSRIESWPLSGDGWHLIELGLRRGYRRGRRRLRAVEEEASVTNLHEWRKRVKDLWYHLRLIRDAEPELIGTLAGHAHDLSDHLGDDHDLAILREEARERQPRLGSSFDQRILLELIDQRRGELRFAAISLGGRIYSQKPKRFTKELGARWREWREREPVAA